MLTLKIWKHHVVPKWAYVSWAYEYLDLVYYNNKAYICSDTAWAVSWETPWISGKWTLYLDWTTQSYWNNKILYTDSTWILKELDITNWNLNFDWTNLNFIPHVIQDAPVKVKYLNRNKHNHSYSPSVIGTDDKVYWWGYYTTWISHASPFAANNPKPRALKNPWDKAWQWAWVYSTYYNLYAWTTSWQLYSIWHWSYWKNWNSWTAHTIKLTLVEWALSGLKIVDVISSWLDSWISTVYARTDLWKVFSFGANNYGQQATGNTSQQNIPIEITWFGWKCIWFSTTQHRYAGIMIWTDEAWDNLYYAWYDWYYQSWIWTTSNKTTLTAVNEAVQKVELLWYYSSYSQTTALMKDWKVKTAWSWSYWINWDWWTWTNTTFAEINWGFSGFIKIFWIDAYAWSRYAIDANHDLYAWGYNWTGQLWIWSTTSQNAPVAVSWPWDGNVWEILVPSTYSWWFAVILAKDKTTAWFMWYHSQYLSWSQSTTANVLTPIEMGIWIDWETIVDISVQGNTTSWMIFILYSNWDMEWIWYNWHGNIWIDHIWWTIKSFSQIKL